MSEKIVVPVLGESITEATVSKWLKNKGETVDADEPIVELETDKVNLEVPSPVTGKLNEINFKDGSTVKVGEILGLVTEIEGENKKSNEIKKIQPSNLQINEEPKEKDNVIKLDPIKEQVEPDIFEEKDNRNEVNEEPLVLTEEIKNSHIEENSTEESQTLSPAVRKMVDENNIDVKSVKGSGKDGRILKGDLTFIGFNKKYESHFPNIRKGVLSPIATIEQQLTDDEIRKYNMLYAKNYKARNDLYIIFKCVNQLG